MSKLGAVKMAGNSGSVYRFTAYSLDTVFRRHRPAVVVITRRRQVSPGGAFKHCRLALRQTDDLRMLGKGLKPGRANCLCVLGEKDEATRNSILEDLRRQ